MSVHYGIGNAFGGGLQRIAALIAAGMPTRRLADLVVLARRQSLST